MGPHHPGPGPGCGCADGAIAVDGPAPDRPGDRGPPLRGAAVIRPDATAGSGGAHGLHLQQAPGGAGGGYGAGVAARPAHLPCSAAAAPARYRRRLQPAPHRQAAGAACPAGPHCRAAAARAQLHQLLRGERSGAAVVGAAAGAPAGHRPGPGLLGQQGRQPGAVCPLRRTPSPRLGPHPQPRRPDGGHRRPLGGPSPAGQVRREAQRRLRRRGQRLPCPGPAPAG